MRSSSLKNGVSKGRAGINNDVSGFGEGRGELRRVSIGKFLGKKERKGRSAEGGKRREEEGAKRKVELTERFSRSSGI